jgi:uncharacterized protein YhfF
VNLADILARHPGAQTFRFGDGPELCAELTGLVVAGRKTATCGALRDVEAGGEPMPVVGRRDVALTWDGAPAVVIETTEVRVCRFDEVDRAFAEAEGEGGYEGWRAGHVRFFERNGGWSEDMMLVCERFRVVEVIG